MKTSIAHPKASMTYSLVVSPAQPGGLASGDYGEALGKPDVLHHFGRIPMHAPVMEGCPLRLNTPTHCPFGGACHTCPVPAVQAKLTVNQAGDKYEQEADRLAEKVMRMPESRVQRRFGLEEEEEEEMIQPKLGGMLQRQCAGCGEEEEQTLQMEAMGEEEGEMQRQSTGEEEETTQVKWTGLGTPHIVPEVEAQISDLKRGGGMPLSDATRDFFEPRFGYDFSHVRVHTNAQASESAQALNAQAYTVGHDVVFGEGRYAPGNTEGKRLLAHELTHVVQQAARLVKTPRLQRKDLHLYDYTDNAARRWGYARHYCENYSVTTGQCHRNRPNMLHAGVGSLNDALGWISHFHSRGNTLNMVYFHTHGAPGYIHLPNGGISIRNAGSLESASSNLVANAVIGFLGCNVAEGETGQNFLLAAGRAMLQNGGGTMYASNSVTFSVPGLGQRRPIWSSLKVVCVNPGGNARLC